MFFTDFFRRGFKNLVKFHTSHMMADNNSSATMIAYGQCFFAIDFDGGVGHFDSIFDITYEYEHVDAL